MTSDLEELIRRRVGVSLDRLPLLERLGMLRRNAIFLRGGKWLPDQNDGTRVRKVVGPDWVQALWRAQQPSSPSP
jgi:hypothetical protein